MSTDLTGGLGDEREYVFPERPAEPGMRDGVNMWVADDRGEVELPRFAVEALADEWDQHQLQVNVGFPDGRLYRLRGPFPSHRAQGPDGRPTVLGTGPLAFRLVEPFRTWTATFRGQAVETSTEAQLAGDTDGPTVDLEFDVEATMAVPPWIQGTLFPEAAEMLATSVEGKLMGGPRFEQLFRATGAVRVRGEEHPFTGSGLRIRRQGVRDITEFWGHAWQSALFPSGRAFGYIAYPPRPDGSESYNEGYLFTGDGELVPAKVRKAPWLRHLVGNGEDVSLELETADGVTRIEAQTVVATYELGLAGYPQFPVLSQCTVRYRWDGEKTYGMLERSSMRDKIIWP
jgi:hypothetical protein